jgi:hypothetical protein
MKKKSISLFTVLVIILAIGSAFTTKPQKKLLNVYAVWGIHPRQVSNPYFDPVDFADLNCAVSEVLYFSLSPLSYSGYSNLEQYRQEYDNGFLMCYSYSDYICMAYVTYNFSSPTNGVVLDLIEGDYEHDYW